MANLDAPNGLSPIYRLGGGAIPSRAYVAGVTTAIFAGDLVKMGTGGRVITETTTTIAVDCIGVAVNYRAVHLNSYYQETLGTCEGMFPHAEAMGDEVISLPMYPGLENAKIDFIIKTIKDFFRKDHS